MGYICSSNIAMEEQNKNGNNGNTPPEKPANGNGDKTSGGSQGETNGLSSKDYGRAIWLFAIRTLSIREGADIEGTVAGIKRDIDFKGPNVWILICSILIASIGLNVNSAAAIIGAMLISPLMGPILGVGLSVGTNDWQTLTRSLKSLGVAVSVSLLTSTIYFLVSPIAEVQSEILARTKPTSLDVLIAFFGGVAGIVAGSRKEKTNVIPGVAIATALMPPLCTSGFGLATGNWSFFFGAFYLFIINCVFIALSTFLIVRYLRFPMVHFVDPKREAKFRKYLVAFVIIVIIPSGFITYSIIKESTFRVREEGYVRNANTFVDENFVFDNASVVNTHVVYTDTGSRIEVFVVGEPVTQEQQNKLNSKLADYDLKNTQLKILQDMENGEFVNREELLTKLEESYRKVDEMSQNKDELIREREKQIAELLQKLNKYESHQIDFKAIQKEMQIEYPEARKIGYAAFLEEGVNGHTDTIPTLMVTWDKKLNKNQRDKRTEQLSQWLNVRLNLDTVRVMSYE